MSNINPMQLPYFPGARVGTSPEPETFRYPKDHPFAIFEGNYEQVIQWGPGGAIKEVDTRVAPLSREPDPLAPSFNIKNYPSASSQVHTITSGTAESVTTHKLDPKPKVKVKQGPRHKPKKVG